MQPSNKESGPALPHLPIASVSNYLFMYKGSTAAILARTLSYSSANSFASASSVPVPLMGLGNTSMQLVGRFVSAAAPSACHTSCRISVAGTPLAKALAANAGRTSLDGT